MKPVYVYRFLAQVIKTEIDNALIILFTDVEKKQNENINPCNGIDIIIILLLFRVICYALLRT